MKGKINTKVTIITILTIVLLSAATAGTVLFLKDSGETAAMEAEPNSEITLPAAGTDGQIETNEEQTVEDDTSNSEIAEETITEEQAEVSEQDEFQNEEGIQTTTPTQSTGGITEEPEATTVEQERIIAEETTLGWNIINLNSKSANLNLGINYQNLRYRVEYYFDEEIDESLTEIIGKNENGKIIDTYTDKVKMGYKLESDTTPLTITENEENNVIKVYYTKRTDLSYTVNYLEEGTDEVLATAKVVNNQTFGAEVTENAIDIEGYNKVDPTSATIEITTGTNEHTFYYTKRTDLSYTVNYLEKGTDKVLAEAKTVEDQTYKASVTEEAIEIAEYDKVEPTEATITIEAGDNVINFYYTKRIELSYTVTYYVNSTQVGKYENINEGATHTIKSDSDLVINPAEGYAFVGTWKDENGNIYEIGKTITINANLNLYAQFKKIEVLESEAKSFWQNKVQSFGSADQTNGFVGQIIPVVINGDYANQVFYCKRKDGKIHILNNGGIDSVYDNTAGKYIITSKEQLEINLEKNHVYTFIVNKGTTKNVKVTVK